MMKSLSGRISGKPKENQIKIKCGVLFFFLPFFFFQTQTFVADASKIVQENTSR